MTLKKLDNRFPHLNLTVFIKGAEETILDEGIFTTREDGFNQCKL